MFQPTATANVAISCQGNWTGSMTFVRLVYGSTGRIDVVANSAGVTLAAGATSWTAASDERLTDVTGTYDNALEDIKKIKPVKFTWKQHPEQGPQVGVIAQSVQDVVPEAVGSVHYVTDANDYLGVRYTELIPIMIAAIQEGTKRIEALEAQVGQLLATIQGRQAAEHSAVA